MTALGDENSHETTHSFSPEEVHDALERVLGSNGFKGSARMRSFLTYVVNEVLAGRSAEIRAKTIAMDVYGYSADDLSKREGVVRVDAGRVRRKLNAYYGAEGATDPLAISLPVGSYVPVFEAQSKQTKKPRFRRVGAAVVALAALVGMGVLVWSNINKGATSNATGLGQSAIYDVSPARVEAMNLCDAGRDVMFPVVDLSRLQPALLIFKTAVERDPLYFCGYAGAAQVETMLAILQFFDPNAEANLRAADENSAHAMDLAPDEAWALSARAWQEFGSGNYQRAVALSRRAVSLAPNDPHIAEFDALISLYTLNFEHILSQSEWYGELAERSGGLVFGNVLGSAQFHTGDYGAAIRTYEDTIERGGPFGPISAAYLMAAHWNNGEQIEARRIANVYQKTWPNFPLEDLKRRVFKEPEPVDALMAGVRAAGVQFGTTEATSEPD